MEKEAVANKLRITARILNLLADKGWSKADFAKKIGKSSSTISVWFNGSHNFTINTLVEIAVVFEVDVTELMTDKEWKPLAY